MTTSESEMTFMTTMDCLISHTECKGGYVNRVTGLKVKCLCKCHRSDAKS
jgi:hypothetical protein